MCDSLILTAVPGSRASSWFFQPVLWLQTATNRHDDPRPSSASTNLFVFTQTSDSINMCSLPLCEPGVWAQSHSGNRSHSSQWVKGLCVYCVSAIQNLQFSVRLLVCSKQWSAIMNRILESWNKAVFYTISRWICTNIYPPQIFYMASKQKHPQHVPLKSKTPASHHCVRFPVWYCFDYYYYYTIIWLLQPPVVEDVQRYCT